MTRNQNSNDGVKKLRATMIIVSLAAVSLAVGAAYSLGIFSQPEPETREPLQITLSSDRLDFGDLNLSDIATRQLILRNDGDRPLTVEILVSDPDLRVSPQQLILHPGVGSRVVVELVGNRPGSLEDQLRVVVDESDEAPLVVALAGRVWRDAAERPVPAMQEPIRTAERRQPQPSYSAKNELRREERQAELDNASGAVPEADSAKVVADASRSRRGGVSLSVGGGTAANVSSASRRPASSGSNPPRSDSPSPSTSDRGKSMVRVTQYDPATSTPIRSLAERPPMIPDQISDEEASKAKKIPSKTPTGADGDDLPDRLPDEPAIDDDDSRDRDLNKREDDNDPFVTPTLTISGQSTVRILGGSAQFYPQAINVVGTDMGGPIGLMAQLEFPIVSLAFGESMLFAQVGAGISGGWDSMTGNVQLQVPLQAVDADGDAAPMQLVLTTGTAMERNESGNVVAISGTPRNPGSGLLRLVGIVKIPVGYKNGGEDHLAVFEILASLTFGTSISSSNPAPIGRIGG